jgi:hypothetical protein
MTASQELFTFGQVAERIGRAQHGMSPAGWISTTDTVVNRGGSHTTRRVVTVAAFVLGVVGFGVAISSLTWQVCTFLMQGARPKLTPIVGFRSGGGLVQRRHARRPLVPGERH